MEVANIGWIGVAMNRNKAYGTRAVMCLEESAVAIGSDEDKHLDYHNTELCRVRETADVAEEYPKVDADLDDDGYVDVDL